VIAFDVDTGPADGLDPMSDAFVVSSNADFGVVDILKVGPPKAEFAPNGFGEDERDENADIGGCAGAKGEGFAEVSRVGKGGWDGGLNIVG
jgi:hypothetical protein